MKEEQNKSIVTTVNYDQAYLAFFGPRGEGYLQFLKKIEEKKYSRMWISIVAAFIPLIWMGYRKMYLYMMGFLAIAFALGFLFPSAAAFGGLYLGSLGPRLYVEDARRKLAKLAKAKESDDLIDAMRKEGGVSIAGAVIGAVITITPVLVVLNERGII